MIRAFQVALAVVLALLLLLPYRPWLSDIVAFGFGHAVVPAVLVVIFGILFGLLGADYGLPSLFWHDRVTTRLSAATAVVLLLATVGSLSFFAAEAQGTSQDAVERAKEIDTFLGRYAPGLVAAPAADAAGRLSRFLLATSPPFLALLLAPALLPAAFPRVPRSVLAPLVSSTRVGPRLGTSLAVTRNAWGWLLGLAVWAVGTALGVAIVAGLIGVGRALGRWSAAHVPGIGGDTRPLLLFLLVLVVFYTLLTLRPIYEHVVSSAFAICTLLGLLASTYSLFAYFVDAYIGAAFPGAMILAVLLGVVWFALVNLDPYKLRLPGMAAYYPGGSEGPLPLGRRVGELVGEFAAGAAPSTQLVDDESALNNWLAVAREGLAAGAKPRLVVVSVSGGALRSGLWVAVVLDRLEQSIPGFGRHVRLITGASGGMLGAAYYLLHRRDEPDPPAEQGAPAPYRPSPWVLNIPRDSLSPVTRFIALRDPLLSLLPRVVDDDRGIRLEDAWAALRFPFRDLGPHEEAGRVPSMVLSPMMVESGRRLLISNLDLLPLIGSEGPEIGADGTAGVQAYSLSALEFARLFPHAEGFRLGTGVRINASFPYVSPAVNLPTDPPGRVVDAGYYDNYGIQVASAWLGKNLHWLARETSGVLLVQIRDAISVAARLGVEEGPTTFLGRAARAFRFFTSPPEAAGSARTASAMFRNDEDVQDLAGRFAAATGGDRSFFATVVFENSAIVTDRPTDPAAWPGDAPERDEATPAVALNWYLSRAARDGLIAAIPKPLAGSPWADRDRRLARLAELRARADAARGRARVAALTALEQAENLERLVSVGAWWERP